MRIAVLGGTGFVGKRICALAQEAGYLVTPISRSLGCDVLDYNALHSALQQAAPEAVIQCAAHVGSVHYGLARGADMLAENCQTLLHVYRAMQEVCPQAVVVHPLSNCCYPGHTDVQVESQWQAGPPHPSVLAYGTTRRLVYALAETYRRQYGMRSVNWLVANAYGPGDKTDPLKVHAFSGLVIRMLQAQAAQSSEFEIWGTGTPIREWIYVDDLARMLLQSVHLQEQVEPVNLAQRKGYSVNEIAQCIADEIGYSVRFVHRTDMPDGDPCKILDDAKFRQHYPDFQFTPLAEGLRQTVKYYRQALHLTS